MINTHLDRHTCLLDMWLDLNTEERHHNSMFSHTGGLDVVAEQREGECSLVLHRRYDGRLVLTKIDHGGISSKRVPVVQQDLIHACDACDACGRYVFTTTLERLDREAIQSLVP